MSESFAAPRMVPPTMDAIDADARGPDDGDARLRAALRALDAEAEREEAVAPDPSRVAGHLAGVGDEGLIREAAAHPAVRRLLSDVVTVAPSAERDALPRATAETAAGPVGAPSAARPGLSPAALARALEAFGPETRASSRIVADASASTGSASAVAADAVPGGHGMRIERPRRVGVRGRGAGDRSRGGAWRAAAAVLALLVPVAVVASLGGRAEAGPAVAVEGFDRVGADGAVATEGPRRLGVGSTVSGLPGERLALRFAGGGRLLLPGDDVVRVACDGARCARALFALDRGEVVLAASGGGRGAEAVGLRLPWGDRLDLVAGAARVRRESDDRVVVVLRDDGVAVWTTADGASREMRGAGTRVLGLGRALPDEPVDPAARADAAEASRALYRDLEFFGGARRDPAPERRIGARRWRIVAEDATDASPAPDAPTSAGPATPRVRVRRSDGSGVPAVRMDLPAAGRARLAWEPDEAALLSRRILVHLRGAGGSATGATAPSSADGATGRVRVALAGVPGAFAEADLPGGADPRPVDLDLRLPEGWAVGRPAGADLVLEVTSVTRAVTVWFECASLDPSLPSSVRGDGPSPDGAPPEGASGRSGE